MFADTAKTTFQDQLRQQDFKVFARWLTPELIAQAAGRAGVALGGGPLHLGNLVWLAVTAAAATLSFVAVLGLVWLLLGDAPGFAQSALARHQRRSQKRAKARPRARHDPRGQGALTVSEEAFTQARRKVPWSFWTALTLLLAEDFQRRHQDQVRWKGLRLLTLDGTTLTLERWNPLLRYFGSASNG